MDTNIKKDTIVEENLDPTEITIISQAMSVQYITSLISKVLDSLIEQTPEAEDDQDEFTKMMNLKRRDTLQS